MNVAPVRIAERIESKNVLNSINPRVYAYEWNEISAALHIECVHIEYNNMKESPILFFLTTRVIVIRFTGPLRTPYNVSCNNNIRYTYR